MTTTTGIQTTVADALEKRIKNAAESAVSRAIKEVRAAAQDQALKLLGTAIYRDDLLRAAGSTHDAVGVREELTARVANRRAERLADAILHNADMHAALAEGEGA